MLNRDYKNSMGRVLLLALKVGVLAGFTIGAIESGVITGQVLASNAFSLPLLANLIIFISLGVAMSAAFLALLSVLSLVIVSVIGGGKFDDAKSTIEMWALRIAWFMASFFTLAVWLNHNTLDSLLSTASLLRVLGAFAASLALAEMLARLSKNNITEFVFMKNSKPRPVFLGWLVVLAGAFLFGFDSDKSVSNDKPNVILLIVDTLRADRLGAYGYDKPTSPNIDRVAENGVLFEQTYVQWASSLPSHSSIMTSLYPHLHGAFPNGSELNPELLTIGKILKAHGYTNGAFVTNHLVGNQYNFEAGFDRFFDLTEVNYENSSRTSWIHSLNLVRVFDRIQRTDIFTTLAMGWLEENADKPMFLWLQWLQPHAPYDPPEKFLRKFEPEPYEGIADGSLEQIDEIREKTVQLTEADKKHYEALYDAEVNIADQEIGKILDKLEELGLTENSIVIITSDHGENLYEHNIEYGHYGVYDSSLRIPLIFSFPKALPQGATETNVVESIDIASTLLEILNIERPKQFQGESLMPLVRDEDVAWKDEAYSIMLQTSRNFFSIRSDDWKIILNAYPENKQRYELYNLAEDPRELNNRFEAEPILADSLKTRLTTWIETNFKPVEMAYTPGLKLKQEFDKATEERLRSLGYIK